MMRFAKDWRRWGGITAGIATHMLFAFTVWHLFWFLKGYCFRAPQEWILADAALAVQFAVPHSFLLLPSSRRRVSRFIGAPFYGLFFCVATCSSLLLMFALWRPASATIWSLDGLAKQGVEWAFLASWASLLYSISLTGLGYQTGLTPWLHWLRRESLPRRGFEPKGVYRFLRHPVYLSFMGLIWFNPVMTCDRMLLACVWTVYIFVGSFLKDERLAYYIGEPYRQYQTQVAGYPLMWIGPLAKRSSIKIAISDVADDRSRSSNSPLRHAA